jgi:hypothetical protein
MIDMRDPEEIKRRQQEMYDTYYRPDNQIRRLSSESGIAMTPYCDELVDAFVEENADFIRLLLYKFGRPSPFAVDRDEVILSDTPAKVLP